MERMFGINSNLIGMASTHAFRMEKQGSRSNFQTQLLGSLKSTDAMDVMFEEAAGRYGVPLNLLKAVGKAESNFRADAVSQAGAIGVMQLMPNTARSLGVDDPYDARSNIMGGAKYLAQKMEQYDGNIELVLASYNAGSGNVAKYGGVPPFPETINYVRKVQEYAGSMLGERTAGFTDSVSNVSAAFGQNINQMNLDGFFDKQEMCQYMIEMMKAQLQLKIQDMENL